MARHYRFILYALLVGVLAGCGSGSFGTLNQEVQALTVADVSVPIRYVDINRNGPVYDLMLTLPEEWVGKFQARVRRNAVIFEYIGERRSHPIFTIEALSNAQYWNQIGSQPALYVGFANTADTYLVYNLPVDAYYAGLSETEYEAFAALVPDMIATYNLARVR